MDPYQLLGVRADAAPDEIRSAYRQAAKKWHPDRFTDPAERERATVMIQQINSAYALLTGKTGAGNEAAAEAKTAAALLSARKLVQANKLTEAAHALDAITERGAEWHYLYGIIQLRRGWQEEAGKYFDYALSLAPENPEYQKAARSVHGTRPPQPAAQAAPRRRGLFSRFR